jgi:hypothetical protein
MYPAALLQAKLLRVADPRSKIRIAESDSGSAGQSLLVRLIPFSKLIGTTTPPAPFHATRQNYPCRAKFAGLPDRQEIQDKTGHGCFACDYKGFRAWQQSFPPVACPLLNGHWHEMHEFDRH